MSKSIITCTFLAILGASCVRKESTHLASPDSGKESPKANEPNRVFEASASLEVTQEPGESFINGAKWISLYKALEKCQATRHFCAKSVVVGKLKGGETTGSKTVWVVGDVAGASAFDVPTTSKSVASANAIVFSLDLGMTEPQSSHTVEMAMTGVQLKQNKLSDMAALKFLAYEQAELKCFGSGADFCTFEANELEETRTGYKTRATVLGHTFKK
jgi:hypothetical protein